jgi:hypothetical protein
LPSLAGGGFGLAFCWTVRWPVRVTPFTASGKTKGQHDTDKAAKNKGAVHSDSCN